MNWPPEPLNTFSLMDTPKYLRTNLTFLDTRDAYWLLIIGPPRELYMYSL